MDAGPSAAILFGRTPATDTRSRPLVTASVPEGAAVTSVVILLVCNSASDARSRTLVVTSVRGGAAITSAVILVVCRPASDPRSRPVVVVPVAEGAAVTRFSGRGRSKPPGDVSSATVNGPDGFCAGALTPIRLTPVG